MVVDCKVCHKTFIRNSYLRLHVEQKHTSKLDVLAPKLKGSNVGKHTCNECGSNFLQYFNLRVHVKKKHSEKLEELAPIKTKTYECKYCKATFQMLKKLTLHKKSCSRLKEAQLSPKNCPLCEFTDPMTTSILKHYKTIHSLEIQCVTLQFPSFEDFAEWKSRIEKATESSFVSMNGYKHLKNDIIKKKYTCHRSGHYRKVSKDIRALRRQGSIKMNAYCPAEMIAEIHNKKCVVKFCSSHVGHKVEAEDVDLKHLCLSAMPTNGVMQIISAPEDDLCYEDK